MQLRLCDREKKERNLITVQQDATVFSLLYFIVYYIL